MKKGDRSRPKFHCWEIMSEGATRSLWTNSYMLARQCDLRMAARLIVNATQQRQQSS